MTMADRKRREAAYFRDIGPAGLQHAATKPWSDPKCGEYLLELGAVLSLLPPPPARLIDIGCGAGWTSALFAARGFEVTGIDLSSEAIECARDVHSAPNLRFEVHDFDEPFAEPDRYELAVFFDALHHSTSELFPLKLAFDALGPGGVCVVCEPGRGHAVATTSQQAVEDHGVTERDMTPAMIRAAALEVGFTAVEVFPHPQRFAIPAYRQRVHEGLTKQRLLSIPLVTASRAFYAATRERHHWGLVRLVK